jgi:hypothetical protein
MAGRTSPSLSLIDLELSPADPTTDADGDEALSDAELTVLALAADPDEPLAADAQPLEIYPTQGCGPLPLWYMPPAMLRGSGRWRTGVVVAVVAAFLLINALGLCITYGQLGAA